MFVLLLSYILFLYMLLTLLYMIIIFALNRP